MQAPASARYAFVGFWGALSGFIKVLSGLPRVSQGFYECLPEGILGLGVSSCRIFRVSILGVWTSR